MAQAVVIKPSRSTSWYRRERERAIKALGGCCQDCGATQNLEIHEIEPILKGGNTGQRTGWERVQRWRTLIPSGGCRLTCTCCHATVHHNGNTNTLKDWAYRQRHLVDRPPRRRP